MLSSRTRRELGGYLAATAVAVFVAVTVAAFGLLIFAVIAFDLGAEPQ